MRFRAINALHAGGAGGIPAESPAVSLQLRGSEMDALLLDL